MGAANSEIFFWEWGEFATGFSAKFKSQSSDSNPEQNCETDALPACPLPALPQKQSSRIQSWKLSPGSRLADSFSSWFPPPSSSSSRLLLAVVVCRGIVAPSPLCSPLPPPTFVIRHVVTSKVRPLGSGRPPLMDEDGARSIFNRSPQGDRTPQLQFQGTLPKERRMPRWVRVSLFFFQICVCVCVCACAGLHEEVQIKVTQKMNSRKKRQPQRQA